MPNQAVICEELLSTKPALYKKTATGAIQFWEVRVEKVVDNTGTECGVVRTRYGQVGSESPQETSDIIRQGKNAGRSNATTAVQQAVAEAESKWLGKKKKGYVEQMDHAENNMVDGSVIQGGVLPMLAEKYAEQKHKIVFPCAVQPKLDGIRCIAVLSGGKCTLWTRTRKPILSAPHIIAAIEERFKNDIILDGELYTHTLRENFNKIVSIVRDGGTEKEKDYTAIQYHVYDMIADGTFAERYGKLESLRHIFSDPLVLVTTERAETSSDIMDIFRRFVDQGGYEGAIVRNLSGLYAHRRSPDLQKLKDVFDDEFEIVGIEEGRGALAGSVGKFVCKTSSGVVFKPKPRGTVAFLRELFNNHGLWQGRKLVVQYKGYTPDGSLREPIGVRFRDSEDF